MKTNSLGLALCLKVRKIHLLSGGLKVLVHAIFLNGFFRFKTLMKNEMKKESVTLTKCHFLGYGDLQCEFTMVGRLTAAVYWARLTLTLEEGHS